jgi:SAM-dependent methyltransferase
MRIEHVALLRCPQTNVPLTLDAADVAGGRIRRGHLVAAGGVRYPIVDFIPRFVPNDNYAASFGFQWNKYARTQQETLGTAVSRERLFGVSGWPPDMIDNLVLEAGSGAGRFTGPLLSSGATVVSFDASRAVEVNHAANGGNDSLLLVQADIAQMPFLPASFDRVVCLGVLQHTPDPRATFLALAHMLKPGGAMATDIYLRTVMRYWLNTRYWVRPLTRRMRPERLYGIVERYVRAMWPLARLLRTLPDRLGEAIVWRLLVADYARQFPQLSDERLLELAILDTFDMLSPAYDRPATPKQYRTWHLEAGLTDIAVGPGPNGLVGRAQRPANSG